MRVKDPRLLATSIVVGALLLATGGWMAHREASCVQLIEQAAVYPGAQVRRDKVGVCRMCRDDGWLYDIAFDRCSQDDPIYAGVRVP